MAKKYSKNSLLWTYVIFIGRHRLAVQW